MKFMTYFSVLLGVLLITGCASFDKQLAGITYHNGIDKKEAALLGRQFIMNHALGDRFKVTEPQVYKETRDAWVVGFYPKRNSLGYSFRADVDKRSGKVGQSGLVRANRGTSLFDEFVNPIGLRALPVLQDFTYVASLTRYYQDYGTWPESKEDLKDFYEGIGGQKGYFFDDLDIARGNNGSVVLSSLEASAHGIYEQYLYHSKKRDRYSIRVIPQDDLEEFYIVEGPGYAFGIDLNSPDVQEKISNEFGKLRREKTGSAVGDAADQVTDHLQDAISGTMERFDRDE